MTKTKQNFGIASIFGLAILALSLSAAAQQVQRTAFDIKHYLMNVTIEPTTNKLIATVDVDLIPQAETRSFAFELNGSLKIDKISLVSKVLPSDPIVAATPAPTPIRRRGRARRGAVKRAVGINKVTFVQDQVGISDLGPSVRVDIGETVPAGTKLKLRFEYSGALVSPEGGPLLTKRLAYVGENEGYLMYAARWFPFHDYAADKATSDITISLPAGFEVVGYSSVPVLKTKNSYKFTQNREGLIGNFSYGRYEKNSLRFGNYDLEFFTKAGNRKVVEEYGATIGRALENYTKRFGAPAMGTKLTIAQIDDESLDYYSQQGMLFLANRHFDQSRAIINERLQREAAYQWWGVTVGLKSFDDAWLSQGLAEYCAFTLREEGLTDSQLENLRRELLEKSLTFEQTASLVRAPASLDDQSIAYQYIMYGKGAFVYRLLEYTIGTQKFDQLLNNVLQRYRGKNISIDEFEKLASEVAGNNLRYFFARWVEGTGVPEFEVDYLILRTRTGKFLTRGTVKQNYDNLRLPVEVQLLAEGQGRVATEKLFIENTSADFNIESTGKPIQVVIDPKFKLLRISDELKISSIARRGIEQFKEGNYVEAQEQFEEALKLDRSNAWIYYHLGLLFLEQRNYDLAIDNFKAARNLGRNGQARPTWLYVWAEIKMGNGYDAKGDRTRAVAAYKRAQTIGDSYDNAQDAAKKYLAIAYDPKNKENTAVK